ncbi:MAG TPA: aldehyde dehydrogenase (NADP(+)) [Terracidiphilus sp.]|nr:aldehyde dehydrogenase (NADP(+)) [Terracidiphilus sp.]
MELTGRTILGNQRASNDGARFHAFNPATGEALEPAYYSASPAEVDAAAKLAAEAFAGYPRTTGRQRAAYLRRIADGLDAHRDELAGRAHLETALPMPRVLGEVGRTSGQLRLFASVVEEGSWVQARIDPALPERKPMPRADIRSMLRALGPVVVFGASNFPLAFSVAGGDTASALAAGCPVIVKAHPAHPGTSELAGMVIAEAAAAEGLHPGVFSLVFDAGVEAGAALVRHPLVRAVAFTGSLRAGRALMDMAAARPDPIPCFTEMASGNPVFVLPGVLRKAPAELAKTLFGSFTLGAGQFCTKPGIVLVPDAPEGRELLDALKAMVETAEPFTLLTAGIAREYDRATSERAKENPVAAQAAETEAACGAGAKLFTVCLDEFLGRPELADEIFGPNTLLVHCGGAEEFARAAQSLDGHLTATVLGDEADLAAHGELIRVLEQKAGRLIFNGMPTGVEVGHAMVHGGPYPATSDPRFTSVGSMAIYRFARPVCFQGFPDAMLPQELKEKNPLGIRRMRDGKPE